MVEILAEKLANSIKKGNEEQTASVAVMKYALIGVINTATIIFVSIAIGIIFNKFPQTALSLFAFALLRFFSGGYHLKSPLNCILVSTSTMSLIPHIPISNSLIMYLTLASAILVAIFAPSNIRGIARLPEKYFPLLKFLSLAIVACNFVIASPILALAFFLQAATLIQFKKEVIA